MALANLDRARPQAEWSRLTADYGKRAIALLEPLAAAGVPELSERLDGAEFDALRKAHPEDIKRLRTQWQKAQAGR